MRSDALLSFIPIGSPMSLVGAAGVDFASPNIIDLLGAGVGVPPPSIIGRAANFGTDMGVGHQRAELNITIGTQPATANGATMHVELQAAPDTGAGGNYQPGAWQTIEQSPEMTVAQMPAGTVIFRNPWVPAFPANLRPRFMRLWFVIPAAVNFNAGTIASALVVPGRDDQANKFAANNFTVA